MTESTERTYPTIDMTKVGRIIRKLHDQVVGRRGRVEVTRDGCDDVLVMISRAELETLENTLAIFADTAEFNEMCENLKSLLHSAGLVYSPQVHGGHEPTGGRFADDRV